MPITPEVRARGLKFLRRLGAALAIALAAIALFYAVERRRGRAAWERASLQIESAGASPRLADNLPRPAAEAENFASVAPALWRADAARSFDMGSLQPGRNAPGFGLWWRAEDPPLPAWRDFLGDDDVAGWIDARMGPLLREVADAARRPVAVFAIEQREAVRRGRPYFQPLSDATRALALRSVARAERGESGAALADAIDALLLADVLRAEPFLVSQVRANVNFTTALQAVRFGLRRGVWSPEQLGQLERALARPDRLAAGVSAMKADFAWLAEVMTGLAEDSRQTMETLADGWQGPEIIHYAPSGWVYQNMARLGRHYAENILPACVVSERRLDLPALRRADIASGAFGSGPGTLLAALFAPRVSQALANCASTQAQLDFARLACALERHRAAHGAYPETLDAEGFALAGPLPRDVTTGAMLSYRPLAEGGFALYSTGADGVDDGGRLAFTPMGDYDPLAGDWKWPVAMLTR